MNQSLKHFLPHIAAYVIMMAVSFIFFSPYVFEGKVLKQNDNVQSRGMQGEITKYRETTGEIPLWTNAQFGGMPAAQIQSTPKGNLALLPYSLLFLKQSVTYPPTTVLVAMICCYLLLVVLGVDWRLSIVGAIGFGLSNYQIDLAEAGHSTKMAAVALVPGVFAGALLAYRGKYLLGAALFGLFMAMEILANHLQITFYMGWMLVILGIVQLVKTIQNGEWQHFVKASIWLVIAGLLGVAANMSRIWPTQEYAEETIRGKSELSAKSNKDGLEKDYIFAWSYGITESMTLLVPNYNGGGASQHFRGTELHDKIYRNMFQNFRQQGLSKDAAVKAAEQQVAATMYWGDQPFVGVAIYFGAVILFLFFMGMVLVKGAEKWWLASAALFMLMIAWGGNFFLNGFLVDHVPFFNKFRAVSMALGLSHLAVIVLAFLGIQALLSKVYTIDEKQRAIITGAGITGGLCLLAVLDSFMMDFSNPAKDGRLPADLLGIIRADRASILRSDAIRSLFFILASAGILMAYLKGVVKPLVAILIVGLLSVLDVWMVNKRILFKEKYETKKEVAAAAVPTPADTQIMKDKGLSYRVLDLSRGNPFTSATASYFHKSTGGYHAAKLMIFQDVAERYLDPKYGQNPLEHRNILGMLNTKYIIQQNGQVAQLQEALGNAWFVDNVQYVNTADEEIAALANLNPKTTALVRQKYADALQGISTSSNPADNIELTDYHPDHMTYQYNAATDRLAVFSEMFYNPDKGWNLYLDGEPYAPVVRANYILRAAKLPAGSHQLEMKFEPRSYQLGSTISLIASILILLGFVGALMYYFRNRSLPDPNHLYDLELVEGKMVQQTAETLAPTQPKSTTKKVVKKKTNKKRK